MSKKFAFILCVNDELYFKECQYYIQQLDIPTGYEVEIIEVRDAQSMCAGYNEGMNSTDAKYKIYMHQDVYIIKRDFLFQLLNRFQQDSRLGIVGLVGGNKLPSTGVIFDCWNEGKVDVREPDMAYWLELNPKTQQDIIVNAVDGLLIATQYDICWRDDLFQHFDFYDVSQCLEFQKKGYKVLVPYQETPWAIHDCSFCKLSKYDEERQKFLMHYNEFLKGTEKNSLYYNKEWEELSKQLAQLVSHMLEMGDWWQAEAAMDIYHQNNHKSSELEKMNIILEIHSLETKRGALHLFEENVHSYNQLYQKYIRIRHLLRRIEFEFQDDECLELQEKIKNEEISLEAIIIIAMHSCIHKDRLISSLKRIFSSQKTLEPFDDWINHWENMQIKTGGKK